MVALIKRIIRCTITRRHRVKFSSYPYCLLCGKNVTKYWEAP